MHKAKIKVLFMQSIIFFALPFAAQAYSWDAIYVDKAISEKEPFYGVGAGDTREDAEKNAKNYCVTEGGENCQPVITYKECGAYALSTKSSGKGEASTKKIAEDIALSNCKDKDCKVLVSDCNK